MVGQDNFSASDLLKYIEAVMKEIRRTETKYLDSSKYAWLKSKNIQDDVIQGLDELKPMIEKLSPEICTNVAVKFDMLTEHETSTTVIITILRNLLEEEDSMMLLAENAKRGKEIKNKKMKVQPVLCPPGRRATVSFVFPIEG